MRPISPYAATKHAGEMICYTHAHLHRLSVLLPAVLYGVWAAAEAGSGDP
jgi:nucleoside-diphosphate-sugar epimerase